MAPHKFIEELPAILRRETSHIPYPVAGRVQHPAIPFSHRRPDTTLKQLAACPGFSVTLSRSLIAWVKTDLADWQVTFEKQGRFTLCAIRFRHLVYPGAAHCSHEDQYDAITGSLLAFRRALNVVTMADDWQSLLYDEHFDAKNQGEAS